MEYVNSGEESNSSAEEKEVSYSEVEIRRLNNVVAEKNLHSTELNKKLSSQSLLVDKLKRDLKEAQTKEEQLKKQVKDGELKEEQYQKEKEENVRRREVLDKKVKLADEDIRECKKMLACFTECLKTGNFHNFDSNYSAPSDVDNKTELRLVDDVHTVLKLVQQKIVEMLNDRFNEKNKLNNHEKSFSYLNQVFEKLKLVTGGVINFDDIISSPSPPYSCVTQKDYKKEDWIGLQNFPPLFLQQSDMKEDDKWGHEDKFNVVTGVEGNKENVEMVVDDEHSTESAAVSSESLARNDSQHQVKDSPSPHENDNDNASISVSEQHSENQLVLDELIPENPIHELEDQENAKGNINDLVNQATPGNIKMNKGRRQNKNVSCEVCTKKFRNQALKLEHACAYSFNHIAKAAKPKSRKSTIRKAKPNKNEGTVRKSSRISQLSLAVAASKLASQTAEHHVNACQSLSENQRNEKDNEAGEEIENDIGKGSVEELQKDDEMEGPVVAPGSLDNGAIDEHELGPCSSNNREMERQELGSGSLNNGDLEGDGLEEIDRQRIEAANGMGPDLPALGDEPYEGMDLDFMDELEGIGADLLGNEQMEELGINDDDNESSFVDVE